MAAEISPHIKRWITGIIAVPLLLLIILYGSATIFAVVIGAFILGGVLEYNAMVFDKSFAWEKWEVLVIAALIFLAGYIGDSFLILAVLTFAFLIVFALYLLRVREHGLDITPAGKVVFGFLYIPLLMTHFILIRRFDDGILWVFFVLVLAFAGDTAAFYVGRTWGKTKLLPVVSPAKTTEGILGLIGGSIGACVIYQQILLPEFSVVHAVILGFIGSILGQLGDLCESLIKRASGVKDSGSVLPGHGGILDRLDSLLFVAPFVYYYYVWIIK
ncbi:MAG: phosphatidate cytidylyltransferase [Deltaproteobacteria bacterium]|nr:phosphatidate cytidylyltransferase [Deltaproteobacteria bacterium]